MLYLAWLCWEVRSHDLPLWTFGGPTLQKFALFSGTLTLFDGCGKKLPELPLFFRLA